ncbi:MAG: hypothetical protein U0586_15620 [Candidatus Brocadiaceae bacterium]
MSVQKKKGVGDIKTHAGRTVRTILPHEAYMKISTLEMERVHRTRELESAQKRVQIVMHRLGEIDAEKDILIKLIKEKTDSFQGNVKVHTATDSTVKENKRPLLRY